MPDLSFILDPGGTGSRPGINLMLKVTGNQPLTQKANPTNLARTANANLVLGSIGKVLDYEFESTLNYSDFMKLQSLDTLIQTDLNDRDNPEVILYNLVTPFSEIATQRTRFRVPLTPITETVLQGSLKRWEYWIAVQGYLTYTYVQKGNLYECKFTFQEGTKLTRSMET